MRTIPLPTNDESDSQNGRGRCKSISRPLKSGVDYFPMDAGFFSDKKIRLLKGEFGARGLLIVLSTLCRVYSTNGYYASFDDDDAILTADELGVGITPELVREVVQGSVKRSLFDEGVFNQFGVLTSPGIQRRFIRAVATRDDIPIFEEYWLLDIDDKNDVPKAVRNKVTFKSVDSKKTPVFFEKTPVNSGDNPQSKLKESKGKKTTAGSGGRPDFNTIEAYAASNLQYLSPANMDELVSYRDQLTDDMIRHAIDEACACGKRTYYTVRNILNRYVQKGHRSMGDVLAEEEAFRRNRAGQGDVSPTTRKVREF